MTMVASCHITRKRLTILAAVALTFCIYTIYFAYTIVDTLEHTTNGWIPKSEKDTIIETYTKKFQINWNCQLNNSVSPWQIAESILTMRHITSSDNKHLGCVLRALHSEKIIHADVGAKGTQLKLSVTLEGNQRAVFKPKAYDRDYIMVGTPYAGRDRHNAEIAAFHLNRIIELDRVPLVVGRVINLETEVKSVAHKNLLNTFYNRNGNTCFYGKCLYCKGPETGVCADGTLLEGSITMWLPNAYNLGKPIPHPWRRTYTDKRKAEWETNDDYCHKVRDTRPYETPPTLLDLIDIAIFDFLVNNADRHHYEKLEYSKESMVVALDNGKSFGTPYYDEFTILAPLYQCCTLREDTYTKLVDLSKGVLGSVLRNVLDSEPLHPVLPDIHFTAVDRRLKTVIEVVDNCISKSGSHKLVLVDDGY